MKIGRFIIGCVFIIGSIAFFKDELSNLKIQQYGKWITVKIIEIPRSCLGTKVKWFMKVSYKGKEFSKQIPGGYCEQHKVNDEIRVKYLNGFDRVLLPDESSTFDFISIAALCLFGFYLVYLSIKKN